MGVEANGGAVSVVSSACIKRKQAHVNTINVAGRAYLDGPGVSVLKSKEQFSFRVM